MYVQSKAHLLDSDLLNLPWFVQISLNLLSLAHTIAAFTS